VQLIACDASLAPGDAPLVALFPLRGGDETRIAVIEAGKVEFRRLITSSYVLALEPVGEAQGD